MCHHLTFGSKTDNFGELKCIAQSLLAAHVS